MVTNRGTQAKCPSLRAKRSNLGSRRGVTHIDCFASLAMTGIFGVWPERLRPMNRERIIGVCCGILLLSAAGCFPSAYDPGWTKKHCAAYSFHGLYETYHYGGDRGWIDNDCEDGYPTEGVDCSAYVPRCLALPGFVAEGCEGGHPYSTASLYPGIANTVAVSGIDALEAWDFWVWREEHGGPSAGHTGLFEEFNESYVISREAQSHQTGFDILKTSRSKQALVDYGCAFWRRKDWGGEAAP